MAQGDRVYLGLIQINAWSNEETVIIFNDGENGTIEDTFIFTDMKNVSVLAERTRHLTSWFANWACVTSACGAAFRLPFVPRHALQFTNVRKLLHVPLDDSCLTKIGLIAKRAAEVRWSRLSEQIFRVDKWSACRG